MDGHRDLVGAADVAFVLPVIAPTSLRAPLVLLAITVPLIFPAASNANLDVSETPLFAGGRLVIWTMY